MTSFILCISIKKKNTICKRRSFIFRLTIHYAFVLAKVKYLQILANKKQCSVNEKLLLKEGNERTSVTCPILASKTAADVYLHFSSSEQDCFLPGFHSAQVLKQKKWKWNEGCFHLPTLTKIPLSDNFARVIMPFTELTLFLTDPLPEEHK